MPRIKNLDMWIVGVAMTIAVLIAGLVLWGMDLVKQSGMAVVKAPTPTADWVAGIEGRWDWTTSDTLCGKATHTIALAADGSTMTILTPDADSTLTSVYDILEKSKGHIRGAIRGETRKGLDGKPIVWDLVMFGPDEYRWKQAGSAGDVHTAAIRRCGAKRADSM